MAVNQLARTHGEILPEESHRQHCDGPHQHQLSPWAARQTPSQIGVKSDSCSGPTGQSNKPAWAVSFIEWIFKRAMNMRGQVKRNLWSPNLARSYDHDSFCHWLAVCNYWSSWEIKSLASEKQLHSPNRNKLTQWRWREFEQFWYGARNNQHFLESVQEWSFIFYIHVATVIFLRDIKMLTNKRRGHVLQQRIVFESRPYCPSQTRKEAVNTDDNEAMLYLMIYTLWKSKWNINQYKVASLLQL